MGALQYHPPQTRQSKRKRSVAQRDILSSRKQLIRLIMGLMQDGDERSSYEIATVLAPHDWWEVSAVLEGCTFYESTMLAPLGQVAENRLKPDSPFEVRHDGRCWRYRMKQGLF